jgi:hypothetical protein
MYEHEALEHNNNNNVHVFTPANRDIIELHTPSPTHLMPVYTLPVYALPDTNHLNPVSIPPMRNRLNRLSHVTALNDECNDDGNLAYHPPTPLSFTSTYLNTLHHDYDNGVPSAVTYMQQLQKYNRECLYEQGEWKVDE